MHTMGLGCGSLGIVSDSAIYIGMTDGIPNVMAEITTKIRQSLSPLLLKGNFAKVFQITSKKILNMMFMHIGAYVPVIPMTENRNIVKENIRTLDA